MLFTTNYKNNEQTSFGPLPQGDYEMVIESTEEIVTPKNNKESFKLKLVVRNDLQQVSALAETNGKHANRIVFHDNWKRDIDGRYIYKMSDFMYILEAAGIPEGVEIRSVDELHEILRHKPVKVYVKQEEDDYNGGMRNTVAPWGYSRSDFPQVNHEFKKNTGNSAQATNNNDPFPQDNNTFDVSDDDLPF